MTRRFLAVTDFMSEADWTNWVIDVARFNSWLVTHFRPALTASGRWVTPVQGHEGFPDLVLARDEVVLFRELKTNTGRLTPDQKRWLAELGPMAAVWRPRDRDLVLATLTAPRRWTPTPATTPRRTCGQPDL